MSTKLYEDDPRLTAYALGELDPEEAREVQAQLADDAEARAFVEEVRATAQRLAVALRAEPALGAATANRALARDETRDAASAPVGASDDGVLRVHRLRWHRALALAASLAVVGLVGWSLLSERNGAGEGYPSIALLDRDAGDVSRSSPAAKGGPAALFADAERLQRLQQPQNQQDEAERREVVAQLKMDTMQAVEDKNFPAALEAANQLLTIDPQNEYARGAQPLLNDRVQMVQQQGYADTFQNQKAATFTRPGGAASAGADSDGQRAQQPQEAPVLAAPAERQMAEERGRLGTAAKAQGDSRSPEPTTAIPRAESGQKLAEAAGGEGLGDGRPGGGGGLGGGGMEGDRNEDEFARRALRAQQEQNKELLGAGEKLQRDEIDGRETIAPLESLSLDRNRDPLGNRFREDFNTEQYDRVVDNLFKRVADEALSTFSVDVDTASYSNMRRFVNGGQLPPPDAVRIEELLNYFDYNYAPPATESQHPFAASVAVANAPWNPQHRLVRIGIKGKEIPQAERPASNLVFLLDVSGSMDEPNKLPLVKQSMTMLAQQLDQRDHVAIVVYAGSSGLVLPSTSGAKRDDITGALEKLKAGGSTNGAEGIQLAYDVAKQNFIKGGINRVILCTDGDFNIGITDRGQLTRLIEEQAKSGVYLSILGFGMGNLKDATMEELTNKGEGNYGYIDTEHEARKLLVEQMQGTLQAIAKDVKIQVEFNPAEVGSYRLIGYENRILAKEDFNDDTKDAGDIGAGHEVTALYEVVPAEVQKKSNEERVAQLRKIEKNYLEIQSVAGQTPDGRPPHEAELAAVRAQIEALSKSELAPPVDESKYQSKRNLTAAAETGELLTVKLRYKGPDALKEQGTSTLIEFPAKDEPRPLAEMDEDFRFAASVAGFGMLLRDSPYKGTLTWAGLDEMTRGLDGPRRMLNTLEGARRLEFRELVEKAAAISGGQARPR